MDSNYNNKTQEIEKVEISRRNRDWSDRNTTRWGELGFWKLFYIYLKTKGFWWQFKTSESKVKKCFELIMQIQVAQNENAIV